MVTYDFIRGREKYVYRDRRLNSICPKLCIRLRDLGINKKTTRRGKRAGNRNKVKDRPVKSKDFDNLIKIQLNSSTNIKNIQTRMRVGIVNCQSIKGKQQVILQNVQSENLDEDWLACSVLNNGKFKMENIHRSERRGGGIAVITQRRYCVRIRTN